MKSFLEAVKANEAAHAPQPIAAFYKFAVKVQKGKPTGLVCTLNEKDEAGNRPEAMQVSNLCNFEVGEIFVKKSEKFDDSICLSLNLFAINTADKYKVLLDFGSAEGLQTDRYSAQLDLLFKLCNLKGKRIKCLTVSTGKEYTPQAKDAKGKNVAITCVNLLTSLTVAGGYAPKTEDWYIKRDPATATAGKVKTLGVLGKDEFLPDDSLKFVSYWAANFNDSATQSYDPELDLRENIDFETGEVTKNYDVEATDVNADGVSF